MRDFFICLILFALTITGVYYLYPANNKSELQEKPDTKQAPVFEENIVRRDVTPDSVLPPPRVEGEKLQRLPAVIPPPPPPKPPKPDKWVRPVVTAAGIIQSGDRKIILSDIVPLPLDKKCDYDEGGTWPCGMMARTEMRQFVRGRPLTCNQLSKKLDDGISTRCKLGGFDISAWLVLTGWATPIGDMFAEELKEAKAKQRGQWRKTTP